MIASAIEGESIGKTTLYLLYVPEKLDETITFDLTQATDYYRTPRACVPRVKNKMSTHSVPLLATFDALYLVDI